MGDPSERLSRYDHGDSDNHDTFDDFVMMIKIMIMIKTQQSIGLAFVAYPEATLTMDLPPLWWDS